MLFKFTTARVCLLGAVLLVRIACARNDIQTVQLFPVADTSLLEQFPNNDSGKSTTLIAGVNAQGNRNRALMNFPVPLSMPPNSVVVSVKLVMKVVVAATNGPAAPVFSLHRFLTNWNAGTRTGDNGGPGEFDDSTWSERQFPDINWGAPGTQAGTDYVTAPSASLAISGLGSISFESTNLIADMQGWVQNPASAWGWILMADDESKPGSARRFASGEQNLLSAPSILVKFYVPDPPLRILGFSAQGDNLILRLGLYNGETNTLEFTDSLSTTNWNALKVFPKQSSYNEISVTNSVRTGAQGYFRFRLDDVVP